MDRFVSSKSKPLVQSAHFQLDFLTKRFLTEQLECRDLLEITLEIPVRGGSCCGVEGPRSIGAFGVFGVLGLCGQHARKHLQVV